MLEGAICREASQHSPRAYWAWRRLGFIQVCLCSQFELVQFLFGMLSLLRGVGFV